MIKCRVTEKFNLKDFDKLKNIKRASVDEKGKLFVNDEFECDEQMAKYLTGENKLNKSFVQVIEVDNTEMPKTKEEKIITKLGNTKVEIDSNKIKTEVKKTTKKKTSKK